MALKRLVNCPTMADAEMIRMELEAESIPAFVYGATINNTLGDDSAQVWVHQTDLEVARLVLESYLAGDHHLDHAGPWTCPNCGEQIDGQFAVCWQCETPQPNHQPDTET